MIDAIHHSIVTGRWVKSRLTAVACERCNFVVSSKLKMVFVEHSQRLVGAPEPRPVWALFLDADGTLFDIAGSPDAVEVPHTLVATLATAGAWLGGALAIVSGRPIAQIDNLLAPLRLPCAGEHGAVIRVADGRILRAGADCAVPAAWKRQLRQGAQAWSGVVVEDKPYGLAVHFRNAPRREPDIRALVESVLAEHANEFEILPARMALEIRHRLLNKAAAVQQLLRFPPFSGRVPVFVGDDVTDEDGFRAVTERGGLALRVDDVFHGRPSEVRRWLEQFRSPSAGGGRHDHP
jgi:trehalose 6-phosphate phosphatase